MPQQQARPSNGPCPEFEVTGRKLPSPGTLPRLLCLGGLTHQLHRAPVRPWGGKTGNAWQLARAVPGGVNALVPQEGVCSGLIPTFSRLPPSPWAPHLGTDSTPLPGKGLLFLSSSAGTSPKAASQPYPSDKDLQSVTCVSRIWACVCPFPMCLSHLPDSHAFLCSLIYSLDLSWTLKYASPLSPLWREEQGPGPSPPGTKGPPVVGKRAGWA